MTVFNGCETTKKKKMGQEGENTKINKIELHYLIKTFKIRKHSENLKMFIIKL